MPPILKTPAQGATFHGRTGTFYWYNNHPPGPPLHPAISAFRWRVKVGSSQYGFDYYLGFPVAGAQLNDPNVSLTTIKPTNGETCWGVVEWQLNSGGSWTAGSPTSFIFYSS